MHGCFGIFTPTNCKMLGFTAYFPLHVPLKYASNLPSCAPILACVYPFYPPFSSTFFFLPMLGSLISYDIRSFLGSLQTSFIAPQYLLGTIASRFSFCASRRAVDASDRGPQSGDLKQCGLCWRAASTGFPEKATVIVGGRAGVRAYEV